MSVLFRIDARLIHATLMKAWVPALGAKNLVIIDSAIAADPRLRNILSISAMELPVRFLDDVDATLATTRVDAHESSIVLFSSLEGARKAIDAGLAIDVLNIGHIPEGPGRTPLLPAVHLSAEDRALIIDLERRGIPVYVQPSPRDTPLSIHRLDQVRAQNERVDSAPQLKSTVNPRATTPTPPAAKTGDLQRRSQAKLRVVNERGLHLRAAHALAQLSASLQESVQVANGPDFVNAKSLLGLTTLGAACGTMLDVVVTGPNPEAAMNQIRDLFATGFGEGVKLKARSEDEA